MILKIYQEPVSITIMTIITDISKILAECFRVQMHTGSSQITRCDKIAPEKSI